MKLKNAGIKSKKELATRLMNGEIFYYGDSKIYFDESELNPFRVCTLNPEDTSDPLGGLWDSFANLKIESRWEDELKGRKKAIPCWVSNVDPDDRNIICLIVSKDSRIKYKYVGGNDGPWVYATPIQPNECLSLED